MWQEQFDYFWDGRRRLVIGSFDGAERGPSAAAHPALIVVSARDAGFDEEPTLVDAIDAARWRAGPAICDLPPEHRFVRLVAPDGGELTLHLGSERDQPPFGDYRLLMTLLPEGNSAEAAVFRLVSLSPRGDVERLAREQTAAAGARLVWAFGQRRAFEQAPSGALIARLSPARRVFPAYQSRLLLEARALETETAADTREAPFAIMQHWLRENGAPRAALRLRIPDSLEESATLLGRTSVALALNQRRRLRGWMQEQKQAGEPIVDLLTFDDIRQATGEPEEYPDAVEANDAFVVANLLNLLLDPDSPEADGVAVRRSGEKNGAGLGETIEIDFYGAALGDEVGLVSPAARAGDLGVAPIDPGGPAFARLFRIEADGLVPRRLADDDPLLDELMRRAATASARVSTGAAARAFAERAAGLKGRREKLVAGANDALARAGFPARFSAAGLWDVFEPLQQANFAALATEAPAPAREALQHAGGYAAYGTDPALAALIARGGPLVQNPRIGGEPRAAVSLAARYAAACGAEGMPPPGLDVPGQLAALRALSQEEDARILREARIGLSPDPDLRRAAALAARRLADVAGAQRAIAHFERSRDLESASALADYLAARRAGRWISATSAPALASLIARAGVEREEEQTRVAAGMSAAAASSPPAPESARQKPKGFFKRLFGG
ncbi:hypothetical protein ACNHKD_00275 [Methylocystis sp. JAN1]|uniref:hypothetical protein n=1 Tax=Methylocystis sp. JAN1 TaxID=3397211 RepID=UPI003FA2D444